MVLPKLQEKVQCVMEERKLNFGNEITKILVLPVLLNLPVKCPKCLQGGVPEMETNCGNGIAKSGRKKKKKELWQLSCRKWRKKKKDATFTTFFTTNYRWLVVIGSNLNLTLRLLFCPNNNNQ